MISWYEIERLRVKAAEQVKHGVHMSVILSLSFSLAVVAIISTNHLTTHIGVHLAAFAAPLPVALYFKDQIARLGALGYAAIVLALLGAAGILLFQSNY